MSNDSGCDSLHAILSGTFGEMYICEIEEARQHWAACNYCQGSLPDAANHLNFIENELLRRIRANIEQLYHRHCSAEHDLLAGHNGGDLLAASSTRDFMAPPATFTATAFTLEPRWKFTEPDESTQRLLLLAEAGQAVQAQLEVMNDESGLSYFHVLDTDSEYSSTKCGPFIASLPGDIQLFVFQSILANDSIENREPDAVTQMGSRLQTLVVNAAPEFRRAFLECHRPVSNSNSEVLNDDRDRLLRVCDKLEHFDDVADSLKAGQMEIIRRWERFGSRASDMEPTLEAHLGLLYARLSESTRRSLQLAEYYYSQNQEPDDFTPAIISFHRAYEAEFKLRLLAPLEARLQREGIRDYGDERSKLMVGGQLNPTLTLGQVLHYVHSDSPVSKVATELGLDVTKIYRGSSELNAMRNNAIHGSKHTREAAGRIRSLLLEQPSILTHLFKETVA